MTIGQERFRILSLSYERAYLMGTVEAMPFAAESQPRLVEAASHLQPLLLEYLNILAAHGQVEFDPEQMPAEPEDILYLAAAVIQTDQEQKQTFLENRKASVVLTQLTALYRQELLYLRLMPKEDQGIFSLN
jgi:Lon protease-like protein